ncbi:hypothetical protein BKA81DRAFT_177437 [Phyllosticta paracitricarpa]
MTVGLAGETPEGMTRDWMTGSAGGARDVGKARQIVAEPFCSTVCLPLQRSKQTGENPGEAFGLVWFGLDSGSPSPSPSVSSRRDPQKLGKSLALEPRGHEKTWRRPRPPRTPSCRSLLSKPPSNYFSRSVCIACLTRRTERKCIPQLCCGYVLFFRRRCTATAGADAISASGIHGAVAQAFCRQEESAWIIHADRDS